ncbi:MAG: hypothetical protein IMZ58_08470 [Thermoplasmata archaeon]|nr:hypothetical protein [Thermoplasmata archaeon]
MKYSSISLPDQMAKKIRKMHKAYEPMMLLSGFMNDMIELYLKTHCPECNCGLKTIIESCPCKSPERE